MAKGPTKKMTKRTKKPALKTIVKKKATAAPAKVVKPKVKTPKPRSLPSLSPLDQRPIPSNTVDGMAFTVKGSAPVLLSFASNQRNILVVNTSGLSGTVAAQVRWDSGTVYANSVYTIPTLALPDDAGGPTSGRAMKLGVSLVNTTQALNRGGRVWLLPLDQRLRLPAAPSVMTAAQWTAVADALIAHPSSHDCDGTHFGTTREAHSHPVDEVEYKRFLPWEGTHTVDEFWSSCCVWPAFNPKSRPMSTMIAVFDSPPTTQSYTALVHGTFYTRWAVDTVLGQSQTPIPVAPPAAVNSINVAGMMRNTNGASMFGAPKPVVLTS